MGQYEREANANTLKGFITMGLRPGYRAGAAVLAPQDALGLLSDVNAEMSGSDMTPIPCKCTEGTLVMWSGGQEYREPVVTMEFSWSPRQEPMAPDAFERTLFEYADRLGGRLGQERVYVEFGGRTTVLRRRAPNDSRPGAT